MLQTYLPARNSNDSINSSCTHKFSFGRHLTSILNKPSDHVKSLVIAIFDLSYVSINREDSYAQYSICDHKVFVSYGALNGII